MAKGRREKETADDRFYWRWIAGLLFNGYIRPMDILTDPQDERKERHGCVTAWLIFMIVANSFVVITYLFMRNMLQRNLTTTVPTWVFIVSGLLGAANIMFAIELLRWKKWAFWGFVFAAFAAAAINLKMGTSVLQTSIGLAGIIVLYAILRIKNNGVSAWDNLE